MPRANKNATAPRNERGARARRGVVDARTWLNIHGVAMAERWLARNCDERPSLAAPILSLGGELMELRCDELAQEQVTNWLRSEGFLGEVCRRQMLESMTGAVLLRFLRDQLDGRRFPTCDQLLAWARCASGDGTVAYEVAPTLLDARTAAGLRACAAATREREASPRRAAVFEALVGAIGCLTERARVEDAEELACLLDLPNESVRAALMRAPIVSCYVWRAWAELGWLISGLGEAALQHRRRWEAFEVTFGGVSARIPWLPAAKGHRIRDAINEERLRVLRVLTAEDPSSAWRASAHVALLLETAQRCQSIHERKEDRLPLYPHGDDRAAALYVEAVELLRELVVKHPRRTGYRKALSRALRGASATHERLGRLQTAREFALEDLAVCASQARRPLLPTNRRTGRAFAH